MQQSQGSNNQAGDDQFQPARGKDDDTEIVHGGAFPIAAMGDVPSVQVSSLAYTTEVQTISTSEGSTTLPGSIAHVVDEENPPTAFEGMAIKKSEPTKTHDLHALLTKNRKCRVILGLVFLLVLGLIVAVVLLNTQDGSKSLSNSSTTQAPTPDNENNTTTHAPVNNGGDNETDRNKFLTELMPLLSNESLAALNDTDSPQSQSLRWLLERSNFRAWPFHRQVQRYAMATIYYATEGPSWSDRRKWLTNETECLWFQQGDTGEFCDENGTLQFLNQSNNALNGKLPHEIGLLSSLKVIDLQMNQISGWYVPSEVGFLTALTSLSLASNNFVGTLPSELGSLTALTRLDLSTNSFTGTVPTELGSLTALTEMNLFSNIFTGTVPSELGLLSALARLDLASSSFRGTVPSEFGSLTALTSLSLSYNDLKGTVLSELSTLVALADLSLVFNSFTGTVPSELGLLTSLALLELHSNSFKGTLPSELGSLTGLTSLTLAYNAFHGSVPSQLGSLTALEYLDLYHTFLNGTVPEKLCNDVDRLVEIYVDCAPGPQCSCCFCLNE